MISFPSSPVIRLKSRKNIKFTQMADRLGYSSWDRRVRHSLATEQLSANKPQNNLCIPTVHVLTASLAQEERMKPIPSYKFTKTY